MNLKNKTITQLNKIVRRDPRYLPLVKAEIEERMLRGKLLNEVKKELKK